MDPDLRQDAKKLDSILNLFQDPWKNKTGYLLS